MRKQLELEIKVGLFVSIGIALIALAILLLGGASTLFSRQNHYSIHFPSVEGLFSGAKVVLGGLPVGVVGDVGFDEKTKDIRVEVNVARKYAEWIRKNSKAEILTQGVLGDKYISISMGDPDQPPIPPDGEIEARPAKDLTQFLSKGDQLMVSLNSLAQSMDRLIKSFQDHNRNEVFFEGMAMTAKNMGALAAKLNQEMDKIRLKAAVGHLDSILAKIDNGTGSLGALINDPGLYYDLKALTGGANRNRIMRNLVRKTIKEGEEVEAEQEKKEAQPQKKKK